MQKNEQRTYALSFETVHATIASETMQEMLDLLCIIEQDLQSSADVLNAYKSLVGLACQNAKRDADSSLLADLKKEQAVGAFLT